MNQLHMCFNELSKGTQNELKEILFDNWNGDYKFKNGCKPSEAMKSLQLEYINKLFNLNNSGISIDLPLQTFYV